MRPLVRWLLLLCRLAAPAARPSPLAVAAGSAAQEATPQPTQRHHAGHHAAEGRDVPAGAGHASLRGTAAEEAKAEPPAHVAGSTAGPSTSALTATTTSLLATTTTAANITGQSAMGTEGEHESNVKPVNMKNVGQTAEDVEENATQQEPVNASDAGTSPAPKHRKEEHRRRRRRRRRASKTTTRPAPSRPRSDKGGRGPAASPSPAAASTRSGAPAPSAAAGDPLEPAPLSPNGTADDDETDSAVTASTATASTLTVTKPPNITGGPAIPTKGEHESFVEPVNMKDTPTTTTTTSTPNITDKPAIETKGEHESRVEPVGMKDDSKSSDDDANATEVALPAGDSAENSSAPSDHELSSTPPASAAVETSRAKKVTLPPSTSTLRLVHPATRTTTTATTSTSAMSTTRASSTTTLKPLPRNRTTTTTTTSATTSRRKRTTTLAVTTALGATSSKLADETDAALVSDVPKGEVPPVTHPHHESENGDGEPDYRLSRPTNMGGTNSKKGTEKTANEDHVKEHIKGSGGVTPVGMHRNRPGHQGAQHRNESEKLVHSVHGRHPHRHPTFTTTRPPRPALVTTRGSAHSGAGGSAGTATVTTTGVPVTATTVSASSTASSFTRTSSNTVVFAQGDDDAMQDLFIPVERGQSWDSSPFRTQEDLNRLWEHLFDDYRPDVPPVPKEGGTIRVGVGIDFVKFKEFDEVAGTMNIRMNLRLCWVDERLSFSAQDFFNMSWDNAGDKVPIRSSMVWTPDVTVMNEVGGLGKLLDTRRSSPLLLSDDTFKNETGVNVLWSRPIDVVSNCEVDMTQYPFDEQRCYVEIGSWASSLRQMSLVVQPFFKEREVHSPEFRVLNITVQTKDVFTRSTAQKYNEVVYSVVLQRHPHFYVMNFVLPMVALTGLAVSTMWMNPGNIGPRVNSGTKMLLCVVSIIFITARHRPAIHGDIWMDRFQSHCLALAMSAVLESLCIDWLQKASKNLSWFPKVDTVDSVLRALICCATTFMICYDASEIKRYNVLDEYASFQAGSTQLLVALVYIIFCGMLLASFLSFGFRSLPANWQRWVLGKSEDDSTPSTKPESDGRLRRSSESDGWLRRPSWSHTPEPSKRRQRNSSMASISSLECAVELQGSLPGQLGQLGFGKKSQYSLLQESSLSPKVHSSP